MLQEQELVLDRASGPLVDEPLLEGVRGRVIKPTEPSGVHWRYDAGRLPAGRVRPGIGQGLHAGTIAGGHLDPPFEWPDSISPD
jgi:hypothetical protein